MMEACPWGRLWRVLPDHHEAIQADDNWYERLILKVLMVLNYRIGIDKESG